MITELIAETKIVYKLKPFELTRLREQNKIHAHQLAKTIGWAPSFQYKLEQGVFETISETALNDIVSAFKRFNVDVDIENRFVESEGIKRFSVKGDLLKTLRQNKNLSVIEFSTLMGWSSQYQYTLEDGLVRWISEITLNHICCVLEN